MNAIQRKRETERRDGVEKKTWAKHVLQIYVPAFSSFTLRYTRRSQIAMIMSAKKRNFPKWATSDALQSLVCNISLWKLQTWLSCTRRLEHCIFDIDEIYADCYFKRIARFNWAQTFATAISRTVELVSCILFQYHTLFSFERTAILFRRWSYTYLKYDNLM